MTNQIQQKTVEEIRAIQSKTKPPLSYIPPNFWPAVARVSEGGNLKYAFENWKGMMANGKWRQFVEAIMRHCLKLLEGENIDSDFGQTHAAHIGCNATYIHWLHTASKEEIEKHKDMDLLIKEGVAEQIKTKAPITRAEAQSTMPTELPEEGDKVRLLMDYSGFSENAVGTVLGYEDDDLIRLDMGDQTLECFVWRVRKVQ